MLVGKVCRLFDEVYLFIFDNRICTDSACMDQDILHGQSWHKQHRPFISMPAFPAGNPTSWFPETCRHKERSDCTGGEISTDAFLAGRCKPVSFLQLIPEPVEKILVS